MDVIEYFHRSFLVVYNNQMTDTAITMLLNLFQAVYPFEMNDSENRLTRETIFPYLSMLYQNKIPLSDVHRLKKYLLQPLKSELLGES